MKRLIALSVATFALALIATLWFRLWPELTRPKYVDPAFRLPSPLELASLSTAARFDFPLGSENGALTYNAQRFTENHHLGDDLNGIGGEDSDLGDPIYAVADGRVLLARDGGPGWGNVAIVLHAYVENGERKYVQSYYGTLKQCWCMPEMRCSAASKSQPSEQRVAGILPISISKCANSSRHLSALGTAKIRAAGSMEWHLFMRTVAQRQMMLDGRQFAKSCRAIPKIPANATANKPSLGQARR
jgi:hypothetical protein